MQLEDQEHLQYEQKFMCVKIDMGKNQMMNNSDQTFILLLAK